jgi:hypothetical protein
MLFWNFFWHHGDLPCDRYPRLFPYAINEDATVEDLISGPARISMFALPLSVEAFQEFEEASNIFTGDSDRSIMP